MHREIAIGAVRLSTDRPRIVAAGGQAELDALAAAEGADVVELRADLFDRGPTRWSRRLPACGPPGGR